MAGILIPTPLGVAIELDTKALSAKLAVAGRLITNGIKGFVNTASRLEKEGRGTEGTNAVADLEKAFTRLKESLVKVISESKTVQTVVSAVAKAFDLGRSIIVGWKGALEAAAGAVDLAKVKLKSYLSAFGEAVVGAFGPEEVLRRVSPQSAAGSRAVAGSMSFDEAAARSRINAGVSEMGMARTKADIADAMAAGRGSVDKSRDVSIVKEATAFEESVKHTVDSFASSWAGGLAHVAELFERFSGQIADAMGGVRTSTVQAMGSVFESFAFLGPIAQEAFGQSEEAARRWAAAQQATIAAVAGVKSIQAFAEASDLAGDGNVGGAALKALAGAGYAAAAAFSGFNAASTLAGPGSAAGFSPVGGGFDSNRFEQKRAPKMIVVNIQNAIGSEQYVREQLIPEINRAVGDDYVVLATHATSSDRNDPGRF